MTSAQDSSQARTADAKWAALIDDRLIPLPRRRLTAGVILEQAGARADTILVRDFNSPNDIGYEPDAQIDLADGNVFRTSTDCEREISPMRSSRNWRIC